MTIEEKLEKAIEFIKSIDKADVPIMTTSDIIENADPYCEECGVSCEFNSLGENERFVKASYFDDLKEKAWHLVFDLEN